MIILQNNLIIPNILFNSNKTKTDYSLKNFLVYNKNNLKRVLLLYNNDFLFLFFTN